GTSEPQTVELDSCDDVEHRDGAVVAREREPSPVCRGADGRRRYRAAEWPSEARARQRERPRGDRAGTVDGHERRSVVRMQQPLDGMRMRQTPELGAAPRLDHADDRLRSLQRDVAPARTQLPRL